MNQQIFSILIGLYALINEWRIGKPFGRIIPIAILFFLTVNTLQSQTNLTLKLAEESVLLDKLVACGAADQQVVFFTSAGTDQNIRTNIQATLNLFPGVIFDNLNTELSSANVILVDGSNPNQPIFSLPDFDPLFPEDISIAFSVKTNCRIIETIDVQENSLIFDTWQLDYQMAGTTFSENFNGVEYKDAIAIPNLNLNIVLDNEIYRIDDEVRRHATISNSGLNSYLSNFDLSIVQEEGMYYKQLIINGVEYSFEKMANASGDTIITANISGEVFKGNTKEFGAIGNEDELFDADEILTVEEVFQIVSCGGDGNSKLSAEHQVSWGCDSSVCREEFTSSSVSIGVGEDLIQITYNRDATVDAGYCEDGTLSITVANNGFEFDDGFGTIVDISTGVGFAVGAEFLTQDQGYQVMTVSIAGGTPISAPNGLINLDNNPDFSTDPDGPGGLEDFDGDGFFDDLRIGEQFEIIATYSTSCEEGDIFDIEEECDNDFRGNFDGKITYANSCRMRNESLFDNFYRTSNSGRTIETCTDPDAFNDNDEFTVIYSGERRMSNFNRTCVGNDEIRVSISIPEGIQLSNKTTLQQDTTMYDGVIQAIDNEVLITFDAASVNLNNDYQVNFVFETLCSSVGPTSFPVEISYFCPECDCSHLWYCGVLEGAVLHAAGAPCAEFICEVGIQTTAFSVERSTFGYTDASFNTRFDPALANKKVALSCDSVVMNLVNIVGNQSLTDSIGLSIAYGNADETDSDLPSFLFSNAVINIQSGGSTRTCQIDTTAYQLEIVGTNKVMHFDLSSCLDGMTLNRGDEISFMGHFAINPEAPIPSNTFKKIPDLRALGYAIVDGVRHDECDSFGELFRLGKLNTVFSGPSNSTYPEGCENTSLMYTLSKSINANAMREFFEDEHRAAVKVDSIEFIYDQNILSAFGDLSVEYRIQGGAWFPLAPLAEADNGVYQAKFNAVNTISTIAGSNQVFQFRINTIPECSSIFGSALGNDLYDIEAKIDYNNRYHAIDDNPNCIDTKDDIDKRQFQYRNPPTFTLETIVDNVIATEETVQWTLEHCNTSFDSDAGITFIQMETRSGDFEILSIENISVPTAIDTLSIQPYGTSGNVFAFADGLTRRGTNANPADICNTYRITARIIECGENVAVARLGWSCGAFDDSNWSPDEYEPCEADAVLLRATAIAPFLSASFEEENSTISGAFCDTSTMVLLVRNEEEGRAFDIQSQIILPNGATLVPNSVEFAYPSSAAYQSASAEPNFQESNDLGNIYQYDNFANLNSYLNQNGLPGFSIDAPDSSEFRLKYRFVSNCDFKNGEVNRYSFQGITACGTASNNAFAETNPIIFEADSSLARTFEIEFSARTPLKSGESTIFDVIIENSSPNVSIEDNIQITFSEIINYIPNSIQANAPASWTASEPSNTVVDGKNVLNLALPAGLSQGDNAVFQFEVGIDEVSCDSMYIVTISTISSIGFTCVINNESCNFDFSSSSESLFEVDKDCIVGTCSITGETVDESILMPDCDSTMYYCFNQYTTDELENFTITDNGEVVDSSRFSICDYRQVCIYTYAQIRAAQGTIQIDDWTVDGQTFTGTVNSVSELVDSMNVWDAEGNWTLLPEVLIIQGGHLGGVYSQMELFFPDTGIKSFLGYDTRLTPQGVSIFLTEGFHELIITDENECIDTLHLDLIQQACPNCVPAKVESVVVENASCGEDNGIATINIDENPSDYTFNWSPDVGTIGQSPNIRTNLPMGNYLVQIIDNGSNECTETKVIYIGNADGPQSTVERTPSVCSQSNGTITFSPSEYTYSWQDGAIGASREGLSEGQYLVTITDPAIPNCPSLISVDVAAISPLTISHTIQLQPNCLNSNGEITLNVEGGSGQYSSSLPGGGLVQTNMTSGAYYIIVTDNITGCITPYFFILNNELHNGAITVLDVIDETCIGDENGRVNFNIDYENGFLFPADTIITDGQRTFQNGSLPAGDYQLIIEDGYGCTAGNTQFSIGTSDALIVHVSKSGECTAQTIGIHLEGGQAPFTFDWADLSGLENEKDRTNLAGGDYLLNITDAISCTLPVSIALEACVCVPVTNLIPTIVAADCGTANGEVSFEIDQNIADYTIRFTPDMGTEGLSSNSRVDLPAGDYEVAFVYKADSTCVSSIAVTIPENPLSTDFITSTDITSADCGQDNGSVVFTFIDNTILYDYSWVPNLGDNGTALNSRVNLPVGTYEVKITDRSSPSCSFDISITIDSEQPAMVESTVFPSYCELPPTGTAVLAPSHYTYTWPDGFIGNSRNELNPGTYEVTYQDPNSSSVCQGVVSVVIGLTTSLAAEAIIEQQPTCGDLNGEVTINITGGTDDYTYSWDSETNNNNQLAEGSYNVTVFDVNLGCQTVVNFEIVATPVGIATIEIIDTGSVSCVGNADGTIQFSIVTNDDFQFPMDTIITDGTAEYENGELPIGSYCLEIRDANNCLAGETCFTIGAATTLALMYETEAACADTGAITLEIIGGETPYLVNWEDLEGTDNPIVREGLDTGTYVVIVTDNNGCTETASIYVPECEACNLPTVAEIITTPAGCTDNTGAITIQLEENEQDYDFVYTLEGGASFTAGNISEGMAKGIYQVSIVYKPNPLCVLEIEVEITENDFADLIPISSPADCGEANGQALLLPTAYTYTWADGFIGNERNNLVSGFYPINVKDDELGCEQTFTLVVDEINLLETKIIINTPPTCGNSDGSVTVDINGGSGDYSFDWQGGTGTQTNLSSGTYSVLVTDNRTGCKKPVVFSLIDALDSVTPISVEETINASCPLSADGEVSFSVDATNVPDVSLDTIISNGHTQFVNGQLPQGEYCISLIDSLGCAYGQACFTIGAPLVLTLIMDIIPQCEEGGSISIEIDGGVAPYSFDWNDETQFGDQANRTDLAVGLYSLTVTDANGCQAQAEEIEITLCEACPLNVGKDTMTYNLTDCATQAAICLDYDFDNRNPYNVSLNGADIDLFAINSCSTDTIATYAVANLFGEGRLGPYTVTSWLVDGETFSGDFTTLDDLIEAMNGWDVEGNWGYSEDSTFIVGGASNRSYGPIEASVLGTPIISFLSLETRIWQRGVSVDLALGVHEVIIQDPRTFCADTITIAVNCISTDTMHVVTTLGELDTLCLSTMDLSGNLDISSIDCYEESNIIATLHNDTCVILEGIAVGEETICIVFCDDLGVCDTTIVVVEVPYGEIEDTILVHDVNTFCIDSLGLSFEGTLISMTNVCEDTMASLVALEMDLDSLCIRYTGITLGEEQLCVEICDDLGVCDTLEFTLTIQNDAPDQILDTIFVGETLTYCFDSLIFPNNITYFENECIDDTLDYVDFFMDPISYCIEYTGENIGNQEACIIICDDENICDTAFFNVEVVEFLELPTAVDDVDTTAKGVPIVLNIKENDIPFGVDEDGLQIIDGPEFGEAILNLDGSITYFGEDFCARNDEFTYSLCNAIGCDTATVTIYMTCVDIVIFTAMSPNRDGINDVFFISDIEKFPNSELEIYNRWGNIVYKTNNYQNNWTGTWKNNQELPDGTYFYLLKLNEPNDDRVFKGFIELHR